MNNGVATFQIGKSGITPGVIEALKTVLKTRKNVRISALRSSGRNRDSIKTMAETLAQRLGMPCEYKIIGFTIALKKRASRAKQGL